MKEKFEKLASSFADLCEWVFAVLMMYSVFIGMIVFVMFLIGFFIGGGGGAFLSTKAGDFMKTSIPISAIAGLSGVISMYSRGKHALTINASDDQEE